MATPFAQYRGSGQQRTAGSLSQDSGAFVYELGSAFFGDARLAVGDLHRVEQAFTKSAESYFVRCRVRVRTPNDWIGSERYTLTVRLDGVARYTRSIVLSDLNVDCFTIAVPMVSAAPGIHIIGVQLERTG